MFRKALYMLSLLLRTTSISLLMVNDHSMRSRINLNLSLVNGNFILITEDCSNFFKRQAASVGPEEEDASPTKDARDDESEVELPSDVPEFWLDL
jgi:hypothetical protein